MSHSDGCEHTLINSQDWQDWQQPEKRAVIQSILLRVLLHCDDCSCQSHAFIPVAWAVATPGRMQNRAAMQTQATKQIYLSPLWRLRGQNAGSSFFYSSFFAVFTPDWGWSLSSSRSLDSCHRNWLHSPSSLRPVDSRVAAGQPIMKWPWSSVSRAIAQLKQ